MFQLSLAADGGLILHLPTGATRHLTANPEAIRLIERIMLDHATDGRKPLSQWELDKILRERMAKIKLSSAEQLALKEEAAERNRQAKAKQKKRALKRQLGINLDAIRISL